MKQVLARSAVTRLPIRGRMWNAYAYEDDATGYGHLALVLGVIDPAATPLVRLHSECLTGDVFGSERCDCGPQLMAAMDMIAAEGTGVVVYIRQHEGRGIGLVDKLRAYALQDGGLDTVEANEALGLPVDKRDYRIGAEVLQDLGIRQVRLLTNNPLKRRALEEHGLEVVEQIPVVVRPNAHNARYLETKREKLGHLL